MKHLCTCLPLEHDSSTDVDDFGPTKCQQHLAKMTDVNTMISRAIAGDASVFRRGSYMDIRSVPTDLQSALNAQVQAMEAYNALPASVRARWATPAAFIAALSDPDCKREFVKFGLAFERSKDGPIEVKVINPVTASADASSTDAACAK